MISDRPDDQAFAESIATTAGLSLHHVKGAAEGAEFISQEEPAIILADVSSKQLYEKLENAVQEAVGLFSDKINANAIHFLNSEDMGRAAFLVESPLFGHFILRNYKNPVEAGEHYGRIVRAQHEEKAFGLAHLIHKTAKVQTVKLQKSTQKQDAVEAVRNFLLTAKFQARMATVIANAVDELLMNAIYDAPVDDLGKPLLTSTPRSTLINLEGRHAVEMQVGFDGKYVAITVVDLFGSLDKVKLLSHVSKMYTEEEYKVKTSVAGAGIGLATVFRSGGSLLFISESRVRTEVTVLFRRTDNFREFKDQFRFLSTQFYF